MYLINITLKQNLVPAERADELFSAHRAWFAKNFEAGNFLILGPYLDREHAGVIIAQASSRAALDEILKDDVYFPLGYAQYEVREFKAAMASAEIAKFQGK